MKCPSNKNLIKYADGLTDKLNTAATDSLEVASHLAVCSRCKAKVDELVAQEALLREELSKVVAERSQLKAIMAKVATISILPPDPSGTGAAGVVGGGSGGAGALGSVTKLAMALVVAGGIGVGAYLGTVISSSRASDSTSERIVANQEISVEVADNDVNASDTASNSTNSLIGVVNQNNVIECNSTELTNNIAHELVAGGVSKAMASEPSSYCNGEQADHEKRLSTIPKEEKKTGAKLKSRIIHYPKVSFIKPSEAELEEGSSSGEASFVSEEKQKLYEIQVPFGDDGFDTEYMDE